MSPTREPSSRLSLESRRISSPVLTISLTTQHGPAVHVEHFTVDVARKVRRQKQNWPRDFIRRCYSAERDQLANLAALFWVVHRVLGHVGRDPTRCYAVYGNAARAKLSSQRFGHRDDRAFRRCVVRMERLAALAGG